MDIEQALSQAELYIRQNQTTQARTILGEILRGNPENEEAWILSAQVSDKPEQVMYCLQQAIRINPAFPGTPAARPAATAAIPCVHLLPTLHLHLYLNRVPKPGWCHILQMPCRM